MPDDKNKIYAECINEGVQVAGLKLAQPTNVSIENRDESVCIKYTDPEDILLSGSPIAQYDGTIIVRKIGSPPTSKLDGIIVSDSKTRNQYKTEGFIDEGLINGTEYYYGIFPYTDDGVFNYKYSISITPSAIYPDAPTTSKVFVGDKSLRVVFELPSNATKGKICWSTNDPELEDTHTLYGNSADVNESPYIIMGLDNDTPYYVTVYSSNDKDRCTSSNTIVKTPMEAELYQFILDDNESDPDQKVTYIGSNEDFKPACMDYGKDKFDYGDWADAFFMDVKPCMLKSNGEVDYYLNPDDYSKRLDNGENSDITNDSYDGNCMIEFPKIYWKIEDNDNGTGTISICNQKLDDKFKCWSNMDMNDNEIDHFYISAYQGSSVNGKIRSLSNKPFIPSQNTQSLVTLCKANNKDPNVVIWYTWVNSDIQLLRLLCILISKSTNSQDKFGEGNSNSYGNPSYTDTISRSGLLDNKGLFYGNKNDKSCIKVFGIENLYGNGWNSIAGYVYDYGTQKVKMTYGQSDGSEVTGYNLTGEGYIPIPDSTVSGPNTDGYLSKVKFTPYGLLPYELSGSATTGYCDSVGHNESLFGYALQASGPGSLKTGGIFALDLSFTTARTSTVVGASLSCKPLATAS